jgi:GNAT superfamily N-acetyltransferase
MTLGIFLCLFLLNGLAIIIFLGIFLYGDYFTISIVIICISLLNYLIIKKGIGTILLLNPHRKLDRTEKKSSIQYLFVAPAWRRRGLGSALVRRLIQEAPLPLYVDSLPNRVSFYTRLGFVPLRTKSSPSTVVPLVYKIDSGVSSTKRRIN